MTNSNTINLVNFFTKEPVSPQRFVYTDGKTPWEVKTDLEFVKKHLNIEYFKKSPPYLSKYLPFIPVSDYNRFISLGEGSTPLIKSEYIGPKLGVDLYFKVEGKNPTGSFKDRGSAVEISIAKELGAKGIAVASTGNMAASVSCYAAAAGIPCFIFVPEDTPQSKLSQVISFGGRIVKVKGSYNNAADLALAAALKFDLYLAGDYALRVEGQKSAAFELVDQMLYSTPDFIIVPIGCGTNLTAYKKGFDEYQELGFIDSMPKIVGAQATGANAVIESFRKGSKEIVPLAKADTLATAIKVADPLDGQKALDAIYGSGGFAEDVTDSQILEAQYDISHHEGLFIESSCASTVAVLKKAMSSQNEELKKSLRGKKVVCVLTGDGLKDPLPILRVAIQPPSIEPSLESFSALYESKFFEGKSISFVDRAEIIFDKNPSKEDLKQRLNTYFGLKQVPQYLDDILSEIKSVLAKGKKITFSDLQDILQNTLERSPSESAFLKVLDFSVSTAKDKRASAKVKVQTEEQGQKSEVKEVEGEGVGPVDAVIDALNKILKKKVDFKLSNYRVNIRDEGPNALVFVEIKLENKTGYSIGNSTSPDIIQASIEAYQNAFNDIFNY